MNLPGEPLFAERFRLGPLLGSGGSSSVYRADDTLTGSPVALKVLHPHLCQTPEARAAFLREGERLASVKHPNIAEVVAVGVADIGGVLMAWIALHLIEGPSLATVVAERGPLPSATAAEITIGILNGLGAAHRAGLVHRDVAPHNVLLTGDAEAPRAEQVRLIDFGLADLSGRAARGSDLLLSTPHTAADNLVVGSAAYLSPEQALGRPVTAAGDVYQAGAVLYFLLTGEQPYPRPSTSATLQAQVSAPPPVPSALVPGVHSFDQVVTTAMAKRPDDRFADAAAFRDAVARAGRSAAAATTRTRVLPAAALAASRPDRSSDLGYLAGPEPRSAVPLRPRGRSNVAAPIAVAFLVAVVVIGIVGASAAGGNVHLLPSASPSASATPTPTPSATPRPTPKPPKPPAEQVDVPTLTGTLAEAEATLNTLGLVVGSVTKVPSNRPASTVLGQTPQAGASVARGSRVDLRIASGSNLVPDVTNLTVTDALATLQAAGFAARSPAGYPDDTLVTGSRPAATVLFPLGATVLVTVAPQTTSLPTPTRSAG